MKAYIIKRFMNFSMKKKLFILCSSLISFSTLLSVAIVYISVSQTLVNHTRRYTDEILVQSQNYLDEKTRNLLLKTNYLQLNEDFRRIMQTIWYEEEELYTGDRTKVAELLSQMKAGDSMIDSIYLNAGDYEFYTYDSGLPQIAVFKESDNYRNIKDRKKIFWGIEESDMLFSSRHKIIPVILPVTIYNLKENDQFLVINLNANTLKNELLSIEKQVNGQLFILNENNELVISGTGDQDAKQTLRQLLAQNKSENNRYQMSSRKLEINEWTIYCVQDKAILLKNVDQIRNMMIAIGILSIAVFSFVAMMLSGTITRPLKKLQELMINGADNGFSQSFDAKYEDEIGLLARCFNEMCIRIQKLMKAVEEEQRQKREAELRSLNAQINPHFLYNTMDCIYWSSMKKGNQEIAEIAINISNIFRLGLNKGKEFTTIENELRHVVSYLEIQKTIYKGKFEYEVACEPEIKKQSIIKLLLQPLAENSIIHGFQQMEKGGKIWITAEKWKKGIRFKVADNGCGIQQEKIAEYMNGENDQGLALSNIAQRLQLHYGAGASFSYVQEEGKGAVFQICIDCGIMEV